MIKNKEIREYLGHNGVECRVKIKNSGEIHRFGDPNPFDRSKDFWHFIGYKEQITKEIKECTEC